MCRKRPFGTHEQRPRPARAAVCRIPCLILCLAYVERTRMARRPVLTSRPRRYSAYARCWVHNCIDPGRPKLKSRPAMPARLSDRRTRTQQGGGLSRVAYANTVQWAAVRQSTTNTKANQRLGGVGARQMNRNGAERPECGKGPEHESRDREGLSSAQPLQFTQGLADPAVAT